ncbi:MAG: hypothetical protein RIR46_588 [Actinomycetota bacterium]
MGFGSSFLPISFFIIYSDLQAESTQVTFNSDARLDDRLIHQVNDSDTPLKFAIWRTNSLEYHKTILCIVVKTYTQAQTPSYPQLFNNV